MDPIRPPAVAGSFYPTDAGELGASIEHCFISSALGPRAFHTESAPLLAGMVPHAGYVYSGACAAHFYSRLDATVKCIVLLGVNHRGRGHKAALGPWRHWHTPMGRVTVHVAASAWLQQRCPLLRSDEHAHSHEHSIEVQLPFLQRVLPDFSLVPISLARLSLVECAELGKAIAELCTGQGEKTLILASSDLSHYLSAAETERLDNIALRQLLNRDPAGLLSAVERENISMCGVIPTAVMLFAVNALGAKSARLLKHCHSGDVSPMSSVVGYASVAIEC
jgi:AmmeMemoRadiSam system protein B